MLVALQTGSNVAKEFLNPDIIIYILMTIRGHFMLSLAKVVELLALENGTTNQNGGAGVPKLSFSIIISSSRY